MKFLTGLLLVLRVDSTITSTSGRGWLVLKWSIDFTLFLSYAVSGVKSSAATWMCWLSPQHHDNTTECQGTWTHTLLHVRAFWFICCYCCCCCFLILGFSHLNTMVNSEQKQYGCITQRKQQQKTIVLFYHWNQDSQWAVTAVTASKQKCSAVDGFHSILNSRKSHHCYKRQRKICRCIDICLHLQRSSLHLGNQTIFHYHFLPGLMFSSCTKTSVKGSNSWDGGGTGRGALTMSEKPALSSALLITENCEELSVFCQGPDTEFWAAELMGVNTGDCVITESSKDTDCDGGCWCCCCSGGAGGGAAVLAAASWFMDSLGGGLEREETLSDKGMGRYEMTARNANYFE